MPKSSALPMADIGCPTLSAEELLIVATGRLLVEMRSTARSVD